MKPVLSLSPSLWIPGLLCLAHVCGRQIGACPVVGALVLALLFLVPSLLVAGGAPALEPSTYKGWKTQCLRNGIVELHVVPEIGGRIIQYHVGGKEFLWVNPELAGRAPTASGLGPDDGWLNYGGDKLWPAPQGWDGPEQWPGPPDAVLDGQPHSFEALPSRSGEAALRLTSRPDPRSGIQFTRVIRVFEKSTRVQVEVTMKNIDTRARRWGIWTVTQLNAAAADGRQPNRQLRSWCPVQPRSAFPDGYQVLFGAKDNPSFHVDRRRGVVQADYQYRVGKIAVDSAAGWVATVDGQKGAAFVQRFTYDPRPHPDNATVEFWHNGAGTFHAYHRDIESPNDPALTPFLVESELLSPFFGLQPGESASWSYEWQAANVGGDYPVLDCTEAGVVAEPLRAVPAKGAAHAFTVTGRFGVFAPGQARLHFVDPRGAVLPLVSLGQEVSPTAPLIVNSTHPAPAGAAAVELWVGRAGGPADARLARAELGR